MIRTTTTHSEDYKQQLPPLVVLRYPGGEPGEWAYVVVGPSSENGDVYVIASSWFDDESEALVELKRLRQRRGER